MKGRQSQVLGLELTASVDTVSLLTPGAKWRLKAPLNHCLDGELDFFCRDLRRRGQAILNLELLEFAVA